MSVVAAVPAANSNGVPARPVSRLLSPFPTREALELEHKTWRELELTFQRGAMPDLEDLVGWEFRGINLLVVGYLVWKVRQRDS